MQVRAVIGVCVVWLAVAASAGCGGAEVPKTSTASGAASSPAEVSAPEASPLSLNASTPDLAIRSWLGARRELQVTGVAEAFLALSTQNCRYCLEFAEEVAEVYRAGGHAEVPLSEVRSISIKQVGGADHYAVVVDHPPSSLYASENADVRHFSGGVVTYLFRMAKMPTGWLIESMSLLE